MSQEIYVNLEFTPNPNTLKFAVNVTLIPQGAANFTQAQDTASSPLARKLFAIKGVEGIMIGTNFVTVTKGAAGNWDELASDVPNILEAHLKKGEAVMAPDWKFEPSASRAEGDIEKRICEILDAEIRPAVAADGGDITFGKYENGIVYLHLQGACSSCPSSIQTLKAGVEQRLKKSVPEIKEVVQF